MYSRKLHNKSGDIYNVNVKTNNNLLEVKYDINNKKAIEMFL